MKSKVSMKYIGKDGSFVINNSTFGTAAEINI